MSDEEEKISKNRFHGLWALTNRDLKKWYQNPVVFVIGIIQPILWLALLGKAMNISGMFSSSNIPQLPAALAASLSAQQIQGLTAYFAVFRPTS